FVHTVTGDIFNHTSIPTRLSYDLAFEKETTLEISGGFRIGDIRFNVADLNLMKKYLEFEPKISFKEGIKRYVDWAKQQEVIDNNFQESLNEMEEKRLFIKS